MLSVGVSLADGSVYNHRHDSVDEYRDVLEGFESLRGAYPYCSQEQSSIMSDSKRPPNPPLHPPLVNSEKPRLPSSTPVTASYDPTAEKKALKAKHEAEALADAAAKAKAALKEAKKQARKDRKKKGGEGAVAGGGADTSTTAATPGALETVDSPVPPPCSGVRDPDLGLLHTRRRSTDTLSLSAIPLTPALTATTSLPSTTDSDSHARSLSSSSFVDIDDPVAIAKAAVKNAKLRARLEAMARPPSFHEQHHFAPPPQPQQQVRAQWEVMLDQMPPCSDRKAPRAARASVEAFKVPLDRQLLVDFDSPISTTDFDLSHNVAAAIVERLLRKYGKWSISFLDPTYRIFLTADKQAAVSYKVCDGLSYRVAVVFGDPLCDPIMMDEVITQFRAFCASRRWRTAFVGVTEAVAKVGDERRWTCVDFAVEQVVNPRTNALLDGTKGKRMMVAVKKLVKDQVLRMYNPADGVDKVLEAFLQAVYDRSYLVKEAAKGDTTAYSTKLSLFALPAAMTYFYTIGPDGLPNGMAGLMNASPGRYLLDPVVSLPDAPRDTSDFLTLAAMGWLRKRGIQHMSFGLEPRREIGEIRGLAERWQADTRMINAASFDAFGFVGKKMLHDKFYPDNERERKLYLVMGSRHCLTQLDAAIAITNATHLKTSPVLRRLIWMVQSRNTGAAIENMLDKLLRKGRISRDDSGNTNSASLTDRPHSPPASLHTV
jgi:hypothetical protein